MHVLTKIFIVLVSLLAVLLVPLVVVYSHNEDSFKAKFESEAAKAAAANHNYQTAQLTAQQLEAELQLQVRELMEENEQVSRERDRLLADMRRLEADVADARAQQASYQASIATLSTSTSAAQSVNEKLLEEVRTMRTEAMSAERRSVELDEALRDITGQLQSAVAARRAMQEELQQLKNEHAQSLQHMAAYVQKFGPLEGYDLGPMEVAPTRDLDARVLTVSRDSERVLAEINVGSRDGVQEGWVLQIGRAGNRMPPSPGASPFLGNLRIIAVDINHATGVVELEDASIRGQVEAGDRVYARRSRG